MAILLVILYGSRARGDAEESSDTDLLVATTEPSARHVSEGKLSLSFYGEGELKKRAKSGDLFVAHIVNEGRLVAGEPDLFDEICRAFQLREEYGAEIANASDLGRFLIRYGARLQNSQLVNRRIAWVARTILIARTAEHGKPIFAAKSLASWAVAPELEALVSNRYSAEHTPRSLELLEHVIARWGEPSIVPEPKSISTYRKHFILTRNAVALQVLSRSLREKRSQGDYKA
jgi:predicted nucleotidyltransferase